MPMKKIYVSPAHVVNTLIMMGIVIFAFIAVWVNSIIFIDDFINVLMIFGAFWLVYTAVIFLVCFMSRKGLMYILIDEQGITSKLLSRTYCRLEWDAVKYIYFAKSYNYGNDNTPIYVVLSNADISRMKNAALQYDRDHQIVIRMTKKNYTCIMHYLDSLESKELSVFKNIGYEALNSHVANVDGLIICIS